MSRPPDRVEAQIGSETLSLRARHGSRLSGDDVVATAELTPFHQPSRRVSVALKIPADTPDGDYTLCVGGAGMVLDQEAVAFPHRFDPQGIDPLIDSVRNILLRALNRLAVLLDEEHPAR